MQLYFSEDKGHSYEGTWGYVPPPIPSAPQVPLIKKA